MTAENLDKVRAFFLEGQYTHENVERMYRRGCVTKKEMESIVKDDSENSKKEDRYNEY